jgi:hypothetical protein
MAAAIEANPTDISIKVMASMSAAMVDQHWRTTPGTCLMHYPPT